MGFNILLRLAGGFSREPEFDLVDGLAGSTVGGVRRRGGVASRPAWSSRARFLLGFSTLDATLGVGAPATWWTLDDRAQAALEAARAQAVPAWFDVSPARSSIGDQSAQVALE